jgi:putative YpdA family bacillithiol system oxidoreductase
MLLTTLAFVALTALLAFLHLRRRAGAAGESAAPAEACPRCRGPIVAGSTHCSHCSAPLQAFDLVRARIVAGDADASTSGPLHAIVRADLCVGCATCVAACPEPGAIRVENKVAIVSLDACKGHASCAAACPVGAIVVTSGAAVQRVEVPMLDANFETLVPGLYVVGELGGRGLIKNAINEGKLASEHVARALPPGESRADGDAGAWDVVIVGSGPAGLSAGLEALRAGLRYVVLEQGSLSDTIAKYPRKKLLLAEPSRVPLYGDLWIADASKEELLQVWQTVIATAGLDVRTGQRVESVERDGELFRVTTADREYRARRVILAMGRRGTPRRLGVPGEERDNVLYDIIEMEAFAGERVLVVGGGDSAVESALGLANQPGTTVSLSYRGREFGRVKDRNRAKLDTAVAAGKVRVLLGSQVKAITPGVVEIEHEGRVHAMPNDWVIVRIGGEAPYPFLERMGVLIVRKELALEDARPAGVA